MVKIRPTNLDISQTPLFFTIWVIFFLNPLFTKGDDWPNWRGPNHDGISQEKGWESNWPTTGPKVLWRKNVGTGFSSFSVIQGRAYTMGNTGKEKDKNQKNHKDMVFCLDAETGEEIWTHSYTEFLDPENYEGGPSATPTVEGGFVYTFSRSGKIYCLRADTGKVIWEKDLGSEGYESPQWGYASSPRIYKEKLFLNAGTCGLALNKQDGSIIWTNGKGPSRYASIVLYTLAGQAQIAVFTDKGMTGAAVDSGNIMWHFPWPSYESVPDPIILDDNKMFVAGGRGKGCALLQLGGGKARQIWRNRHISGILSSYVHWNGYVYGFGLQAFNCIPLRTGKPTWSQKGLGNGSVMLADEKLIMLTEKGLLIIAEVTPRYFKKLASAQVLTDKCWTVPVLANGRIYARSATGEVVCLDVRKQP
jgi:outer membrane protein assembly factor BamB